MVDAPPTDRKRRGSLMINYFLVMLFLFGCVQLYFNGMQEAAMNHQMYHISDFQRRHFVKAHSKSSKNKVEEYGGDHQRNIEDENELKRTERKENFIESKKDMTRDDKDDSLDGELNNSPNGYGGKEEEGKLEHKLAGLNCDQFGGPSRDDAYEMVFWEDIPSDSLHVSPFHRKNQKQYLTFEADHGTFSMFQSKKFLVHSYL
jgi:hypothetical protein